LSVAFARWDPIRDLLAIQQRLDRYAPGPTGWTPAVDILETTDQYIVIAEVPGMSRDELDIRVHEGRLTIAGERHERTPQCDK
jgi:HSP20 family molecular chaperone IbpA